MVSDPNCIIMIYSFLVFIASKTTYNSPSSPEYNSRQVYFPSNAKTKSNEMNKYCSCHYEYIYKCPDFCDGSGNELWPLPQSVSYNLKYVRLDTHLLKFYTQAVWLGRLDNCIKLRKLASNWLKLTMLLYIW